MSKRNWYKIAEREFTAMSSDYQQAWADLHDKSKNRINKPEH